MKNFAHSVCTGRDPKIIVEEYPEAPLSRNPNPDLFILLVALTFFIAFEVKLLFYKKKHQVSQINPNSCQPTSEAWEDFRSALVGLLIYLLVGIVPGIVIKVVVTPLEQRQYPTSLFFLCAHFGPHFTVAIVIPLMFLARKPKMRETIKKQWVELFAELPYMINN